MSMSRQLVPSGHRLVRRSARNLSLCNARTLSTMYNAQAPEIGQFQLDSLDIIVFIDIS